MFLMFVFFNHERQSTDQMNNIMDTLQIGIENLQTKNSLSLSSIADKTVKFPLYRNRLFNI